MSERFPDALPGQIVEILPHPDYNGLDMTVLAADGRTAVTVWLRPDEMLITAGQLLSNAGCDLLRARLQREGAPALPGFDFLKMLN